MPKPFSIPGDALKGKTVLVTGASGFIGGRLVERLAIEHGVHVRALVRSWHKATWLSRYPVELIKADIRDRVELTAAVQGCNLVFHCANGGGSDEEYWDVNVNGMRNIISACNSAQVQRLVFLSTIAVHGPEPPAGAGPNDKFRFVGNGYADSKIEAEKLLWKAQDKDSLNSTVLRPTFVWGPRSQLFTVRPLLAMRRKEFRLVDGGNGDCHAVFVETLVDAIISASVREEAIGRAFLVTDGYGLTWREFYAPLARCMGLGELPSLSSTSVLTRARCQAYEALQKRLERWKGNPAPLWRKGVRRTARIVADQLGNFGVMSLRDLKKYARKGALDTSASRDLLEVAPRYSFEEAWEITEKWIRDQLSVELALDRLDNAA